MTAGYSSGLLVTSLLLVSSTWGSSPALAQPAEIIGEMGGRYFEYECPKGHVLMGLRGSAGVIIDNLQAVCGRIDEHGKVTDIASRGPVIGHARPEDKSALCPADYAVTSASAGRSNDFPHLVAIQLACTELVNRAAGGILTVELRGSGNLYGHFEGLGVTSTEGRYYSGWSNCPGQYAVGIRGRADEFIAAFGLICGPAVAARTLNKHRRRPPSPVQQYQPGLSAQSDIPGTSPTLNKRKRPTEPAPPATDSGGGVSIFTDGSIAPGPTETPAPPAPAQIPPSPAIGGSYMTTVAITDSQCVLQNLKGTWARPIDIQAQPNVIIPLNEFSNIFAAPVSLNVAGLRLSQNTSLSIRIGDLATSFPARLDGAFQEDGSRFDVRFSAASNLCRVSGTIAGIRN